MAWLLRDGGVLAALEIADTRRARRRGLLGRDRIQGALLLRPARAVHTIGMRFPIDVAFVTADGLVLDVVTMRRYRLGRPRLRARAVVEAEAGAFARWRLLPGDVVEIRG
ncbi:MAG: DUF192 domain-containing protein [Acidimicrobiales bacterium]|nr:DUF192 domain-containing protein [Acidimicrobiales bacterium]